MVADAAAVGARLPRARPEPRVEPNEPIGWVSLPKPVVGFTAGKSAGAEFGAPDFSESDMVCFVFERGAHSDRSGPGLWLALGARERSTSARRIKSQPASPGEQLQSRIVSQVCVQVGSVREKRQVPTGGFRPIATCQVWREFPASADGQTRGNFPDAGRLESPDRRESAAADR